MLPPEQLPHRLENFRRKGVTFDPAWTYAMASVRLTGENSEWRPVLEGTRPAWESAYEGRPDAQLDHVAVLAERGDDLTRAA